ncbi:MAG: 3-hydroxybutyrate dehydrogenase [Dongiaceae bacterium]
MNDAASKSNIMTSPTNNPKNVSDLKTAPDRSGELVGKSAIVTGSTSGIGFGIAKAFAEAGMNVMLNGFGDAREIEFTRQGLEEDFGVKVAYSAADMSRSDHIAGMVEAANEAFGQVDVLVNNAGIFLVEAIDSTPPGKWDATLAINLTSEFHAIRTVLPGMKARGWGRIITIASALGLVGAPNSAAYVASKHGAIGLTKTVALETAEYGITVNAICPGYVLTPLVARQIRDTAKARGVSEEQVASDFLAQVQPTKRFVTTGEIGALAAFLCSAAAAAITGAALPVDGGWTAR